MGMFEFRTWGPWGPFHKNPLVTRWSIPICEPWCWYMNPYICPCPKSPSCVGFYIPAPWFAYGIYKALKVLFLKTSCCQSSTKKTHGPNRNWGHNWRTSKREIWCWPNVRRTESCRGEPARGLLWKAVEFHKFRWPARRIWSRNWAITIIHRICDV